MHHTEHHKDQSHLSAKNLQGCLGIYGFFAIFQRQGYETNVDKVKANHQQVVDGIGKGVVAKESIDQEDASILVECASDPDGQRYADCEVGKVRPNRNWITAAFDRY